MIPVQKASEPKSFEEKVRQPGLKWLEENAVPLNVKLSAETKLPPYWREALPDLHASYGGICAYLCVFIERVTGGCSVDHYVAKSSVAGLAYDWDNYRLACSTMNARKNKYDDVLDPFDLRPGMFALELVTGRIYPNAQPATVDFAAAEATMKRLGLDDADVREMRVRRFTDYVTGDVTASFLKRHSPFIWSEALRQNLL